MESVGVPTVVQWVNDPACLCDSTDFILGPAQWVKDLVFLQFGLRLEPGNFHMPWMWPTKKKEVEPINIHLLLNDGC